MLDGVEGETKGGESGELGVVIAGVVHGFGSGEDSVAVDFPGVEEAVVGAVPGAEAGSLDIGSIFEAEVDAVGVVFSIGELGEGLVGHQGTLPKAMGAPPG